MRRFEGKVAIVAGGATGIGAATARRLASEGASVVIGDVHVAAAEKVAASIAERGGRAIAVAMDLAEESSVRDMVERTVSTYGGVDVLDNNAADTRPKSMLGDTDVVAIDMELWDEIFAINLRGFALTSRHVIPAMLERGGGAIVNIASGSGMSGEPDHVAYGCSKAGVMQLARHIATRWGKDNIRANAIAPGLVVTEKVEAMAVTFKPFADLIERRILTPYLGRPDDIAATVAFLLSDDARYITGQVIPVDGGHFVRGGAGRDDDLAATEAGGAPVDR
jgi:NAD(P)-dependent dehydrogenase (short-subunit alcohol dehydrogenase family)